VLIPVVMSSLHRVSFFPLAVACIAISVFVPVALWAGTGVVSELPLPTGAVAGTTVVTPMWTFIAQPDASYKSVRGEQVPSGGEVLVFSNTSPKMVRRLRSTLPYPHSRLSRCIAASGDIVVVTDGTSSLRAFNAATGAALWRRDFPINLIRGIATDGLRVLVGFYDELLLNGTVLDLKTGDFISQLSRVAAIDYSPGDSLAIDGGWLAMGSPRSTVDGFTGAGMVLVVGPFGTVVELENPAPSNGDQFGESIAISGHSLYVGCHAKRRIYHFDIRSLTLVETIEPPSAFYSGFGAGLRASGHLLMTHAADGPWLYDRNSGALSRFFTETGGSGSIVIAGGSLCGALAVAPAGSKVFRAVGVSGGLLDGGTASTTAQTADDISGAFFSAQTDATLHGSGTVLFCASVTGGGSTPSTNTGLWAGMAGSASLLMREGAPVGSATAGTAFRPFYSQDGSIAYSFSRSATGASSLWFQNAGSMVQLIAPGSAVFLLGSASAVTVSKINSAVGVQTTGAILNASLRTTGTVDASKDSVIMRPGLISQLDAREGSESGVPSVTHGQLSPRIAAAGTRIAYTAFLQDRPTASNLATFTKVLGTSTAIAFEKGQPAPGTIAQFSTATLSSIQSEAISTAATLIVGQYKAPGFTAPGIWTYQHSTTQRHAVAWARGAVPGQPSGVTWRRFLRTFLTTDGTTTFLAQIQGPGINSSNDLGLWRCSISTGAPTLLLREGQQLPNSGGARIGVIQVVDTAPDGTWAALASLSGSPSSQNQILLGGRLSVDSAHASVLRKGHALDASQPGAVLLGLALASNHTDAAGVGHSGQGRLTHTGAILHRARYRHGTELAVTGIWGY
jgi:hypothetical protein